MSQTIVIRKTPFLFIKRLVLIEFLFAALPFVAILVTSLRDNYNEAGLSRTVSYDLAITIVLTTLQVLILIIFFLIWYLPTYEIDRERISHRRANLFEDRKVAEIASLSGIEIRQSGAGRRLGYGTLLLDTSEPPGHARLKDIPNPVLHAELIDGLIAGRLRPGAGYAAPVSVQSAPVSARAALPEPKTLPELISGGENQVVEFKSSLMWDYRQQKVNKGLYEPVMKNIVAFMNTTGGTLLIGVDDEGQALGLEPDYRSMRKPNADGFENVFNMAFNKMIGVEYRQFVDLAFPRFDGQEICVATVRPASQPAYLIYKGTETFYIRAGNATQPLTVSKATRYIRDHFEQ